MAKVKSVEFIGLDDVYNMEVDDHHNYSVNGGLILHNCDAIRYFVAGRPVPKGLIPFLAGGMPGLGAKAKWDFNTEQGLDDYEDEDDDKSPGFFGM